MSIDLSALTAPDVIESLDFEEILAAMKAWVIATYPVEEQAQVAADLDRESEPANKILQLAAYWDLNRRASYNDEARALLLAHSTGSNLDHIGVTYYQEERLVVTPADPDATPPVAAVKETDEEYRQRLALKPESYSVAGPREAYRFHALSAHGQVKAAEPMSPMKGSTVVYVLSKIGDGIPSQEVLDAVEAALSDEDVRPLSEDVSVEPAEIVAYTYDVDLYVYPGPGGEIARQAAEDALAALAANNFSLGGAVVDSATKKAAHQAGIKRAVVNQPVADIICTKNQAPRCDQITVRIAGVEE